MKLKKIAAVLLCATTLASMPYTPMFKDTLQSLSISAEAADTRVKQFTSGSLTYQIYKNTAGTEYAVVSGSSTTATSIYIDGIIQNGGKSYPVNKILSGAFKNKTKLQTLTINPTVDNITIETGAFSGSALKYFYCYAKVIYLDAYAFQGASRLNIAQFSDTVKTIYSGYGAFFECYELTKFSVAYHTNLLLGNDTFKHCRSLSSVTLPSTIKSIPEGTFYFCSVLKQLTIPTSVTSIGADAFKYCSLSGTVTIPASVKTISDSAFTYMPHISAFSVSASNTKYQSIDGVLYTKGGNTLTLLSYPAKKTSKSYSTSATKIPDGAFYENTSLVSLSLTKLVHSTSDSIFMSLSNLEHLTIPTNEYNQSAEKIFGWYADLLVGSKLHRINNYELVLTPSGKEPCFNSKFSAYINANFPQYSECYFMKLYNDKMAEYVVNKVTDSSMSDVQKAMKLQKWIMNRVTYDPIEAQYQEDYENKKTSTLKSIKENHVDASVFLHKRNGQYYTVCDGYARCYEILMNKAGIETHYVSGRSVTDTGSGHAWNRVKINGDYYYVDVCWNDVSNDPWKYFMASEESFRNDGHSQYKW